MDISFNEEAGGKTGNAAQNVSLMNKIALMIIKKNERKGSVKAKGGRQQDGTINYFVNFYP
ncbi:MAG: hypothetical protein ACLUUS_11915 [Bacteroides stercoris]